MAAAGPGLLACAAAGRAAPVWRSRAMGLRAWPATPRAPEMLRAVSSCTPSSSSSCRAPAPKTTKTAFWETTSRSSFARPGTVASATPALALGGLAALCTAGRLRAHVLHRARPHGNARGVVRHFSSGSTAGAKEVSVTTLTTELRIPANDTRQYRVLELANGLQVLLASDPTADTAAAALTVRCGTFQDPDHRLGLAHFHEHMLFLGTDKYPKEDEYHRFLAEHGGDSNAYTMSEYTTYYFKVAAPHLSGALDRFSQFFIGPTFDPSSVQREMHAVDSESTNYSTEDAWRLLQVLKATVADQHPFARFDVGNLQTLGVDDPVQIRSELIEWNHRYYQAGAMKLAIVGKEDLQELERLAVQQFGPIRGGVGEVQRLEVLPWPTERLGRIVSCVPLKETRSVSVCWPLPPQSDHLFAKPELYISHVLGHEGEGSLHDVLNQRGWVDQLSAGPTQAFCDAQLLAVNIGLTPEGDAHRHEVLALLFEYVSLVQRAGPQEATYRELAALQEISFAHKEEAPAPDDFAASAAMALHKYPPHEAIRGPFAVDEWRPDIIKDYMEMLTPKKSIVFFTSPEFAVEASAGDAANCGWKCEKWYGAPFKEEFIKEDLFASWNTAALGSDELQLPEPNRFIPQDFSLRCSPTSAVVSSKLPMEVTPPELLLVQPMLRLWHKTDCTFKTPREYVLANICTMGYSVGPDVVAMMRLFCSVVSDDLNSFAYDAVLAGLGYGLDFSDSLSMSVSGFNDKLPELLSVVLQRIEEVLQVAQRAADAQAAGAEVEERGQELHDKLETQRQILVQDYRNFTREEPWSICSYYSTQLVLQGCWHLDEYVEILENGVSLAALVSGVKTALKNVQVEVLLHGNVTAAESTDVGRTLCQAFEALGAQPLLDRPRKKVVKLPHGATTIMEFDVAAKNPAQENCCTENVYQVGPVHEDLTRDACLSLVAHLASTSVFQTLRTEQQLGYFVQAGVWAEHHVVGLCVFVQGNRLHPQQTDSRIEEWISKFHKELTDMSDEEFVNNVHAVVSERTQRYATLAQESSRHWSEIQPRRYNFDSLPRIVNALKDVTKRDVLTFLEDYIVAGAPSRRKMSIRVLGTSAGGVRSTPEHPDGKILCTLDEIRAFKATCDVFLEPAPRQVADIAETHHT